MLKYAMFDMDGTLLDSMRQWRQVLYEYVKAQKYDFIDEETLNELMGKPAFSDITKIIRDNGYPFDEDAAHKGILRMMAGHYKTDITVKDGVREFLEENKKLGVRMCVITATAHRECEEALRYHGLDGYFDFVLTDEDYPRGKYGEEIFLGALRRFGANAGGAVLYDDALYSLRTADGLGIITVGVEDATQAERREEIREISDLYITTFENLTPEKIPDTKAKTSSRPRADERI